VQVVSFQQLDEFFKNQKSLLSSTPSIWPTRGWVTSGFGMRKSPFTGLNETHKGWDIGARMGSQIRTTADGVVVVAGRKSGYGKMVEIDHGYGISTRYGHNSKNLVEVGDRVKRGALIGMVGSTGRSTGPHLHYEVLLNGVPVNPKNYIFEE
jgi:murein DD-endopeptidase MepM/ murein hydrolase activator NlpD